MSISKEISGDIGERLKNFRISNSFSTNKFAEILGIAQSAITKIENGNAEPSAKTLKLLLEKFDIDPLWLLTGQTRSKITSPTALKIGQLADSLSAESQKRVLEALERELMLEQMLAEKEEQQTAICA